MGMTAADCRLLWSMILEQVYWSLLRNGSARLLHLGVFTISDNDSYGVRFRSAKFVRGVRRQVVNGDPDEDSRYIAECLAPLRGLSKRRGKKGKGR